MRQRLKTIAFAAVVAAFTVAGLAIAQDDGDGDPGDRKVQRADRFAPPPPGGPGPIGGGRNLTYSETHLREDDEDVVVRTDKGKVVAGDEDSIEIERNDGETLDIPVDDDTDVFAGPRKRNADVEDIAAGRNVIVVRRSGSEAAEVVAVLPKRPFAIRMRMRGGPPPEGFGRHELPAPPPSADGGE